MTSRRTQSPHRLPHAPWSLGWLAAGLAMSLMLHFAGLLGFLAVPWEYLSRYGEPPPFPTRAAVMLGGLTAGAIALGAYAVRASKAWERRFDGWAMASALATFAALAVAVFASHVHGNAILSQASPSALPFAIALGLFGAGFALAVVAAVTVRRRRTRGWALAAFGLVIPPCWGWAVWHEEVQPYYLVAVTDDERALVEVADANKWIPDPRVFVPCVRVGADGKVAVRGEVLFDPEHPDGYEVLRRYLYECARRMKKAPLHRAERTGPRVPDDPLLLLADADAESDRVLAVLSVCADPDVRI